MSVTINIDTNHLFTRGLTPFSNHEIKLLIQDRAIEEYLSVVKYLIDYILSQKVKIIEEQTVAYHSWMLKFITGSDSYLHLWEVQSDGSGFAEGADVAIQNGFKTGRNLQKV